MNRLQRARLTIGTIINRLYENGLILCLAVSLIVNGRAALHSATSTEEIIPFLHSDLRLLNANPATVGWALSLYGVLLLIVMAAAILWEWRCLMIRVLLAFGGIFVYIILTVATLTGPHSPVAAERYETTCALFLLAFIVNLSRSLAKGDTQ